MTYGKTASSSEMTDIVKQFKNEFFFSFHAPCCFPTHFESNMDVVTMFSFLFYDLRNRLGANWSIRIRVTCWTPH